MKNVFFGLLLISAFTFVGCGDDDPTCTASDFVGTWNRQGDEGCAADPDITADATFTIEAGTTAGTVMSDGIELTVNECTATFGGIVTVTLDGDVLTSTFGPCSWEYKK